MTDAPPLTCYRHPDRPTRLACSTCGRPICVECSRDAAVGQKCPDCSAPEGRHKVVTAAQMRRARSFTPVTFAIIAITMIVFIAGEFDPSTKIRIFSEGAHVPRLVANGEWWRAITVMFLHDGFAHILFNMWALFALGPALEFRYGSFPFAAMYLACGIGGSALYQLVGRTNPAVGASGAIFGLMGALLATGYRQRFTPAGRAMYSQVLVLLALNLALPFIVPNVAWEAHIGGLVTGVVVATVWERLPAIGPAAAGRRVAVALAVAVVQMVVVVIA